MARFYLVIARRFEESTWQSKEKIAKNVMKFIIFWIAVLLLVARNDVWGIYATMPMIWKNNLSNT